MIPSPLVDRLSKLIPMLGSDQDGEVINAARAIQRALTAENLDLHAVVEAIDSGARTRSGLRVRPGRPFNYASAKREADPLFAVPEPDAATPKFGLPLAGPDSVESWAQVAAYCLRINKEIPKKFGGRSLKDFELRLLDMITRYHWPTNREAVVVETILARCHQARDAQRSADPRRAA
jgi:hypothetical protein